MLVFIASWPWQSSSIQPTTSQTSYKFSGSVEIYSKSSVISTASSSPMNDLPVSSELHGKTLFLISIQDESASSRTTNTNNKQQPTTLPQEAHSLLLLGWNIQSYKEVKSIYERFVFAATRSVLCLVDWRNVAKQTAVAVESMPCVKLLFPRVSSGRMAWQDHKGECECKFYFYTEQSSKTKKTKTSKVYVK